MAPSPLDGILLGPTAGAAAPGHGSVLHARHSSVVGFTADCSTEDFRVGRTRDWYPTPQVAEHAENGPQSPTSNSAGGQHARMPGRRKCWIPHLQCSMKLEWFGGFLL